MTMAVESVAVEHLLRQASEPAHDMQALSQQFEQLMAQNGGCDTQSHGGTSDIADSTLGKTLSALDHAHTDLVASLNESSLGHDVSMQDMAAQSMQIMAKVAEYNGQFSFGTTLAQGAKDGMQTLLKNQ